MVYFPVLSVAPERPLTRSWVDNMIKDSSDAGYTYSRPRYTRLKRKFSITYVALVSADIADVDAFIETIRGADAFTWVHPTTFEEIVMTLDEPITISDQTYGRYKLTMNVTEQ